MFVDKVEQALTDDDDDDDDNDDDDDDGLHILTLNLNPLGISKWICHHCPFIKPPDSYRAVVGVNSLFSVKALQRNPQTVYPDTINHWPKPSVFDGLAKEASAIFLCYFPPAQPLRSVFSIPPPSPSSASSTLP